LSDYRFDATIFNLLPKDRNDGFDDFILARLFLSIE
jgi:hypothetical protein